MGFRFRKSLNLGGFRINISKSGIGYSFGSKWMRVTKKAKGGMRTTYALPGTGISHVSDSHKARSSRAGTKRAVSGGTNAADVTRETYENPEVGEEFEIVESSRSEMIDKINDAHKKNSVHENARKVCFILGVILVLAASVLFNEAQKTKALGFVGWALLACVLAVFVVATVAFGDYSMSLEYDFSDDEFRHRYEILNEGLKNLEENEQLCELQSVDPIEYKDVKFLQLEKYLKSEDEIREIKFAGGKMIFLPDVLAVFTHKKWVGVDYRDCTVEYSEKPVRRAREVGDATLIRNGWKYETKSGNRDMRYSDNPMYYEYMYGCLYWKSDSGLELNIFGSGREKVKAFCDRFNAYIEFHKSPITEVSTDK